MEESPAPVPWWWLIHGAAGGGALYFLARW